MPSKTTLNEPPPAMIAHVIRRQAERRSADYITKVALRSWYGHEQPVLELVAPAGTSYRATRAALYQLAAIAELETLRQGKDGWIVRVEHGNIETRGIVVLELVIGSDNEKRRGLKVLEAVAAYAAGGMQ